LVRKFDIKKTQNYIILANRETAAVLVYIHDSAACQVVNRTYGRWSAEFRTATLWTSDEIPRAINYPYFL